MKKKYVVLLLVLGLSALVAIPVTFALANGANKTQSDVYWTWGTQVPSAASQLVRNESGISADFNTSGLTPDQAVTLWFIVFNYPEKCLAGSYNCGPADMGANRPAKGDFMVAGGHVIDASGYASFGGRLNVGDTAGSGLAEFTGGCMPGLPNCGGPIGLVNVDGALVVLAVHSHGPKLTGQDLKSQISSYLGGCQTFIGTLPGGFAASEAEVPVNIGECSTTQVSPHLPSN